MRLHKEEDRLSQTMGAKRACCLSVMPCNSAGGIAGSYSSLAIEESTAKVFIVEAIILFELYLII